MAGAGEEGGAVGFAAERRSREKPEISSKDRRHLAGEESTVDRFEEAGWKPAFRPARCRRSEMLSARQR